MTVSTARRDLAARRVAASEHLIRALEALARAYEEMRVVAVELEELDRERIREDES